MKFHICKQNECEKQKNIFIFEMIKDSKVCLLITNYCLIKLFETGDR